MNSIEIGKVTKTFAGKVTVTPLLCSYGYGVTCGELGTTNGQIAVAAEALQLRGERSPGNQDQKAEYGYRFALELGGKPWDFDAGRDALNAELVRIWRGTALVDGVCGMRE